MSNKQGSITFIPIMTILYGAVGVAVAALVAGAAATLLPRQAQATPGEKVITPVLSENVVCWRMNLNRAVRRV
jgi:hypothetical protein